MTALIAGVTPGTPHSPAAMAVLEYQLVGATDGRDSTGRWLVQDTYRWPKDTPHKVVTDAVLDFYRRTRAKVVYDRSDTGEIFWEAFNHAYRIGAIDRRPHGPLLMSGQLISDAGWPRTMLVNRFASKLGGDPPRIVVLHSEHSDELERQIRRFQDARRKPSDIEARPEDLLMATALAAQFRSYDPGAPRFVDPWDETWDDAETARAVYGGRLEAAARR